MENLHKLLAAGWAVEVRRLALGEIYLILSRPYEGNGERYSCIGKTLEGALACAEAGDVCPDHNCPTCGALGGLVGCAHS